VSLVCASEKHSAKVTGHMLDIMTPLISEADSVSQELLDVVLGYILEPFKVYLVMLTLKLLKNVFHGYSDLLRTQVVCYLHRTKMPIIVLFHLYIRA